MLVPTNKWKAWYGRETFELVFLHVPKCGGTFVETVFKRPIAKCPTQVLPGAAGHLTYREYSRVFADHGLRLEDMTVFTVIRNPWDWHVSWFHYLKQDTGGRKSGHRIENELFQTFDFSRYVSWLEDPDAPASQQGYMRKQLKDYLIDDRGRIAVNRILRQESLATDLRTMASELDLAVRVKETQPNSSKRDTYRVYYSDHDAEIIARRHVDDIRLFGYVF